MLEPQSTVKELNISILNIEVSEPVKEISKAFKKNPRLPGIILLEQGRLVGLISKKNFFQYMSRPYSLEIAARRPIKALLHLIKVQKFIVPQTSSIIHTAARALRRTGDLINEPIIVKIENQKYGIIDAHELLIHQAKIHEYTCELLTQMYRNLEAANQKLSRANQKLEYLSRVDDLTQIANRRAFKEYLEREWQRGQKHQMPLAVIICSVDFFTEYNNEYGALAGDSCLQNIATTIRDCLLVKQENLVARYDGANFAIAMPNNNALSAAMIAENIRLQIMKLAIKNKNSPISDRLTLSLGVVSLLPNPYNSPEFLNLAAQRALQVAKKQGRNCKIIWNNAELDNINESSSPEVQITFTKTKLKNTYASNKYLRKFI